MQIFIRICAINLCFVETDQMRNVLANVVGNSHQRKLRNQNGSRRRLRRYCKTNTCSTKQKDKRKNNEYTKLNNEFIVFIATNKHDNVLTKSLLRRFGFLYGFLLSFIQLSY